jgi:hypothetical protein
MTCTLEDSEVRAHVSTTTDQHSLSHTHRRIRPSACVRRVCVCMCVCARARAVGNARTERWPLPPHLACTNTHARAHAHAHIHIHIHTYGITGWCVTDVTVPGKPLDRLLVAYSSTRIPTFGSRSAPRRRRRGAKEGGGGGWSSHQLLLLASMR